MTSLLLWRKGAVPRSRSHQPSRGFTVTNKRLQGEIKDVLLSQITTLDTLRQQAERVVSSPAFHLNVHQSAPTTFEVEIRFNKTHLGSTAAQISVQQSATDLQEVVAALGSSLTDGWVWQVT